MSHRRCSRPIRHITLFILLVAGQTVSSHDTQQPDKHQPPPTVHPFQHHYGHYSPKRSGRTPIILSSLRGPAALPSSSNRMLLVDLSSLSHHDTTGARNIMPAVPYEDYYTLAYDSSDPWEESSGSEDHSQRHQRSLEDEYGYRMNEIGSSNRLLVPYTSDNAVGLHYAPVPFLEDVLALQGSREDALTDFLQEHARARDSKRSVFSSESWQPGGHHEPPGKNFFRKSQSNGFTNFKWYGAPQTSFIFSSQGWHPGGRKRRSSGDILWSKRNIFFSRGWGAAGDPLRYPKEMQKKPAPHRGADGTQKAAELVLEPTVGQAKASALMSNVGSDTARSQLRPRHHWGIPHLFGSYW